MSNGKKMLIIIVLVICLAANKTGQQIHILREVKGFSSLVLLVSRYMGCYSLVGNLDLKIPGQ